MKNLPSKFVIGADLSLLKRIQERGDRYYSHNKQIQNPINFFRQAGFEWARLRLFHAPSGKGAQCNSLPYTLDLAKELKQAGFRLLLDIHYSDTWADGTSTDLTFTVTKADFDRAVALLEKARDVLDFGALVPDAAVVKVSVIGVGMRSHAGVAKQMFQALADKAINIQVISTSEIKISVLIAEEYLELALRALHTAYGLDAE